MKNLNYFNCFFASTFLLSSFIYTAQANSDQLQSENSTGGIGLNFGDSSRYLFPAFTDGNNQLEETIRTIVLQLRNGSAIQIPGVDITDPMTIPDFNTTINEGLTNAEVKLRNVSISGISQVALDEGSANLAELEIGIGLNISKLVTTGQYNLKGKYSFIRLSGTGDFSMNVTDAYVTGKLYLTVNENGHMEVSDIELDLDVNDIELWFENLFGGGLMSKFSNTILNVASPIIFNSIKPTLLDEMKQVITTMVNSELENLPAQPNFNDSQIPLDLAIANTATQLRNMNFDPFPLPSQDFKFSRKFLFVRLYGNLSLSDGYFSGLSSIHRTGAVKLIYKENSANATAEIGFSDLKGGYKWKAHFMGISRSGAGHFAIKQIQASVVITQVNEQFSHPIVDQLKITHIQQMALDMDGIGSFDYIMEFLTNFFTNAFKKQFAKILEKQVKEVLQENLQQFEIPF
ncbi:hypothetical protein CHUAL_007252 [Chamberlinius hualienensis]